MIKLLTAAALALGIVAAPAAAATYDAFTSFNGTQGAGGFTYGSYDGSTFTPYSGDTGCSNKISNVICLGDLPGVFKTTSGAHSSGSVNVPADALILHPGNAGNLDSALVFTAPVAAIYKLTVHAFVADNSPSGVILVGINPDFTSVPLFELTASNPDFAFVTGGPLLAGQSIGFAINYDGVYYNDSTGLNFTFSTVPEPATWGLMITGFALTGFGARRRRAFAA